MKKTMAVLGALTLGAGIALVGVMPASAHVKSASVNRTGASVSLTSYDSGATAEVTLDGVVEHTGTFGGTLVAPRP